MHCGEKGASNFSPRLCPACVNQCSGIGTARCTQCAAALTTDDALCLDCLQSPQLFERTTAFADYSGVLQHIILAYKFHQQLKFAPLLADILNHTLTTQHTSDTLIIPIPQHDDITRTRGFVPLLPILTQTNPPLNLEHTALIRLHHKTLQINASAAQRRTQIKGAFAATRDLSGVSALLIDDVYTTGATLNEAAKVCLEAGAKNVQCVVLARGKWVK